MSDVESRLTALEAELTKLQDREAIRDVLYLYCRGVDRLDAEVMKSCYHEDAYDTHWFNNGPAVEFSEWVVREVLPFAHTTVHSISNPIIELDGDRAFVESHVHVLHEMKATGGDEEKPYLHQLSECRYVDLFEKRQGQWKISYRHSVFDNVVDFRVPVYPPLAPSEAFGRRADKNDPVYAGFELLKRKPEDFRMNFFDPFKEEDLSLAPAFFPNEATS